MTFLIEGEEEVGSENLERFVHEHREELRADIALISDTSQFAPGVPAVTYGLRGLCYMEVFLTGPDHDLHSGQYGGAVPNPANVLCELLGSLHDLQGKRVTPPGFYDDVVPLSDAERAAWKKAKPFDERQFAADLGLPAGNGEAGYSSLERQWARPTLDINGLERRLSGPGAKTVILFARHRPSSQLRLVPNMDPAKVQAVFEQTLRERCPKNVKIEFKRHGLAGPVLVPTDSPATRLAAEALEIGFGSKPTFMRGGGSIPVVELIKRELCIDTLLIGFGLPDDRVHSPNEKFALDALHRGTRTAAALYEKLGTLGR